MAGFPAAAWLAAGLLAVGAAAAQAQQDLDRIPGAVLRPRIGSADPRQAPDPQSLPWRALGRMQTDIGMRCTGVLIGPRHVLTAAHCLAARQGGGFVQPGSVHFLLGYHRGAWRAHAAGTINADPSGMARSQPSHRRPDRQATHRPRARSSRDTITGGPPMNTIDPRRDAQPTTKDLTAPTTGHLIAGAKVSGTEVYSLTSEHIGSIEDVMLDKATGRVAYAVLSFGGFMGMGSKHYPLPWEMLRYDTALGGYVVKLDKARLERAPVVEDGWADRRTAVDEYWATPTV